MHMTKGMTRLNDMWLGAGGYPFSILIYGQLYMKWRRKWLPTPVFLPGESHGRGARWAIVHGVAGSQT